jgi:hypothetical protein
MVSLLWSTSRTRAIFTDNSNGKMSFSIHPPRDLLLMATKAMMSSKEIHAPPSQASEGTRANTIREEREASPF